MYAKIFGQMYDGTLATNGPWQALVTFQQMLVLADQEGIVDMTIPAICRRTTIPREIIETGIAALLLPDPESRTPTEDGRRIVPLSIDRSWGWRIVNYVKYRQIKRESDRREYHRDYWHKRKERDSSTPEKQDSTPTQPTQPTQPIAYADANAEAATSLRSVDSAETSAQPAKPKRQPKPREPKPKASRICPTDWEPSPELLQELKATHPGINVASEEAAMRLHEFAKPYTDWALVLRRWCARAEGFASQGGGQRQQADRPLTPYQRQEEAGRQAREAGDRAIEMMANAPPGSPDRQLYELQVKRGAIKPCRTN